MQSVALPCLFFQVKHHIFEREEGERFKDLKDDRSYISLRGRRRRGGKGENDCAK